MFNDPEFEQRFRGRFFGKRRALVVDVNDPRQLGRVRVKLPQIYGADASPWAWPNNPMGGSTERGSMFVPPLDAHVWVEFEEGLPSSPIYTGGFFTDVFVGRPTDGSPLEETDEHQGEKNSVPNHARGLPDGTDFDGSSRGTARSPESSFAGTYPNVRGLWTPGGHALEFDDTPGAERVLLRHKSGSMIEMLADGSVHVVSEGVLHTGSAARSDHVDGPRRDVVKDSMTLEVTNDLTINVGGTYRVTYGRGIEVEIASETKLVKGDQAFVVDGSFTVESMNAISLRTGSDFNLDAMGNGNIAFGGSGSMVWSNAQQVPPLPLLEAARIQAMNGALTLQSTDLTGMLSRYGVQVFSQESPSMSPVPTSPTGIGPLVRLGNLLATPVPPPVATLLVHEPVPMGMQLHLYLQGLHAFLTAWMTDYLAHAHPWFSPSYTAVPAAAVLPAQLAALQTTWLTPVLPKMNPLLLSDVVYATKV